jgi:anti-sigma regulatory factor (Ser/Thr protein kinase)
MASTEVLQEFSPEPPAASHARRFLRGALGALTDEDGGDLVDSVVMAANELITNAVLHGRTDFSVRVLIDDDVVRVEVSDENSRLPQPCLAPSDATSGRGLALVDGSGLDWGIERRGLGKCVWLKAVRRQSRPPI